MDETRAKLPVLDVAPLLAGDAGGAAVARGLDAACRRHGFFSIVGHGVEPALQAELEDASRAFFALPLERKMEIRMERGGAAWRGYFPVGGELTSGLPDQKEGLYFGAELPADDARVRAGTPLHGPNLFPAAPAALRPAVLAYLDAMTRLGHALVRGLAMGLGLPPDTFEARYTGDPLILFRVFHYPPLAGGEGVAPLWSVGEHTDYGLLTILRQTGPGLQVEVDGRWIDVPVVPDAFVCNIGDMLERLTGGLYRSTPHRVRNESGASRLSFPFFFDPGWTAEVRALLGEPPAGPEASARWDGASVHGELGTYGEYLLAKVSRVFPALGREVL